MFKHSELHNWIQVSNPQRYSVRAHVAEKGGGLHVGCQVINNTGSPTVDHSG